MMTITRVGSVLFEGSIKKAEDLSAVELAGDWLLLASDETNLVQVLKRQGDGYAVAHDVVLNAAAKEIDIEGLARDGDMVYVLGSHSYKRKKVDPNKSYKKNREAMETVTAEPDTDRLCRFRLNADGTAAAIEETTLRPFLDNHAILRAFAKVPGKENGIDLEGLAASGGRLYVGCRSPVLRGNFVPVLRCKFAKPLTEVEVVYLNLGGRGVRDLTRAGDGLLVLAGPSGEGPGSWQVYWWDGEDGLPGARTAGQQGVVKLLGELPVEGDARPEALALLAESDSRYELLVIHDGVTNGLPTRYRVSKA